MRKTLGLMTLLLGLGACSPSQPEASFSRVERPSLEMVMVPPLTSKEEDSVQEAIPSAVYIPRPELSLLANPKDEVSSRLHPYGTLEGRYQRIRRWHSKFYEVEQLYGIPAGYLAGLGMQESAGDPLNLNNGGDGGAGLMMFQPGTARAMGMKVYGTSRATGKDVQHGDKLETLVKKHKHNLAKLSTFDERFNPNLVIPAAGKLLSRLKERYGTWEKALSAYRRGSPLQNLDQDEHVQKTLEFARYYVERNNGVVHPGDFTLAYHYNLGVEGYQYIVQAGDTISGIKKKFQQDQKRPALVIRDEDHKPLTGTIHSNQRIYLEINPVTYARK
jgi:hypothetical protein